MSIARTLLALGALSVLPSTLQAQTTVAGFTPGSFRVTETGAAEYRIPIRVPPGIAGMEPKLALVYNSHGGNGLVGVGWNLEGLSAITRCPKTVAQDGVRGGINYDWNDRYCLDGQRLIPISGSYGADGTEYRTERESFIKVISYGTAGNGPAWFKAWTKSGQIIEYGNTADSMVEAQGKTTVRLWVLNKASDTKGNYFTVSYTEDNANGEYRPARIDYTGNASSSPAVIPNSSLRFEYELRSDQIPLYQGGSLIKTTVRMTRIKAYAGAVQVNELRLAYDNAGPVGRSRLTSVTQCDVAATCLAPTTFAWNAQPNHYAAAEWSSTAFNTNTGWFTTGLQSRVWPIDVNGDGLPDLLGLDSNQIYVQLNSQAGFQNLAAWGTNTFDTNAGWFSTGLQSRVWPIDVNGDGLPDLLGVNSNQVFVQLNTGTGFQAATWGYTAFDTNAGWFSTSLQPRVWTIDVNGDGLPDLLGVNSNQVFVQLNTGTGFQDATWGYTAFDTNTGWFTTSLHPRVWPIDVNGDGLPDLLGLNSNQIFVQLNTGAGFQDAVLWGTNAFDTNAGWFTTGLHPRVWPIDVNGDGLPDLLGLNSNQIFVQINTGTGFQDAVFWGTNTFDTNTGWFTTSLQPRVWVVDVNGDGLPDLLAFNSNQVFVQLNTGTGFQDFTWNYTAFDANAGWFTMSLRQRVWPKDLTGNGTTAILGMDSTNLGQQLLTGPSGFAPWGRITSITDGLGAVTIVDYRPLPQQGVYTRDTGATAATYPNMDIQGSIYVASSVNRSNAIGGTIADDYKYGGAKSNYQGRGFLGFRWMEVNNLVTGVTARSEFRQDWPYVGLPSLVKKAQSSGAVLSQATNTYSCTNPATGAACTVAVGNRYFPYLSQSLETGNDLNGGALPTVTTTTQYDSYGNATSVAVNTGDGYSKTTSSIYVNDTANWLLGRLRSTTVTSTAP
jgi:hypothetical protein